VGRVPAHARREVRDDEDPEGEWGDAWIYEDKVIYVQKKFVAIPKSATPGDDVSKFEKTVMTMTATTYDDMRPGCFDAKERKKDSSSTGSTGRCRSDVPGASVARRSTRRTTRSSRSPA